MQSRSSSPRSTSGSSVSTSRKRSSTMLKRQAGFCEAHGWLVLRMRAVSRDPRFGNAVIVTIVLAGVLIGVNTYPIPSSFARGLVGVLDEVVAGIFITELVIKVVAEGRRPLRYFGDRWNYLDFAVVMVGLLPIDGQAIVVLRLARLMRVLKLVRALPELRILVTGLLDSVASIGYISLLMLLLFYMYAVIGVTLFATNDPWHFGTLHIAMVTLWRVATLEDHTDVLYTAIDGCKGYGYDLMPDRCTDSATFPVLGPLYFVTFVILSSMLVLNLFVGVVTSAMGEAREKIAGEGSAMVYNPNRSEEDLLEKRLQQLTEEIQQIARELEHMAHTEKERTASASGPPPTVPSDGGGGSVAAAPHAAAGPGR